MRQRPLTRENPRRHKSTRQMAAEVAAMPPLVRQPKPEVVRDARYLARKARLEQERLQLDEQLKRHRESIKSSERDVNPADSDELAQNEQALGNTTREITFISDKLSAVHAAMRALEDGTYGRCEDCGHDIPEIRLAAIPDTKQCIDCV